MKTKFIILGLLIAFAVPAFAQRDTIRSNKNEFSFGYGVKPSSSFRYSPGHHYYPLEEHVGAIYATYTRRLTKVIGIGATYCFDPRVYTYYEKPAPKMALSAASASRAIRLCSTSKSTGSTPSM